MKKNQINSMLRLNNRGAAGPGSVAGRLIGLIVLFVCSLLALPASAQDAQTVIKLKTEAPAGTVLRLQMQPYGEASVEGLEQGDFFGEYIVKDPAQEITIIGRVSQLECYGCRLTGLNIEQAPELYILKCYNNRLTTLDVSMCPELAVLECGHNSLTALDVSANGKLETLKAEENRLTTLTTGEANTALSRIECGSNELDALDLSACTALEDLYAENNRLTALDLSKNTGLWWLKVYGNHIAGEGMDRFAATLPQAAQAAGMLYVVDTRSETEGNECLMTHVEAFRNRGWVTCDYAGGVDNGTMVGTFYYGKDYQPTTSDRRINMTTAKTAGNQITLDISVGEGDIMISGVKETAAAGKQTYTLTEQDIVIEGDVTALTCSGNELTALTLAGADILTELDCSENLIESLDMTGCTALKQLHCQENNLKSLNVEGCTALLRLDCYLNNIKAQRMTDMMTSLCDGTANEPILFVVDTKAPVAERNICLKSDVEIATGKKWTVKDYINGEYYGFGTKYDGTDPVYYNVTIEASEHGRISIDEDGTDAISVLNGTELHFKAVPDTGYELESLTANDVDITDGMTVEVTADMTIKATFRERTLPENYISFSRAEQGHVSLGMTLAGSDEAPMVEGGTVSAWNGTNLIVNMTDDVVKVYGNIETLQVLFAQLTMLDVSHCPTIKELNCGLNDITELDLSSSRALTTLSCEMNLLTTLDLSTCNNLTYLNCYGNRITGEGMTALVNSLPARTKADYGQLIVIDTTLDGEGNICLTTDAEKAMAKYWAVFDLKGDPSDMTQYFGSEPSGISSAMMAEGLSYNAATGRIMLPHEARAEVFRADGTLIDSRTAQVVDLSTRPAGIYIIRYDGKTVKVVKR